MGDEEDYWELFITAETDRLGVPYQFAKLEVLYEFVLWVIIVIGELLYLVLRSTFITDSFRSKTLTYEVYLCAVISTSSRKSSKRVPQGRFAVSSVYTSLWMICGVLISTAYAGAAPLGNRAGRVFIFGRDWAETLPAIQLIACSVNMYASYMCAINWRWWSFQFFQREYVFWVIMAIGDIIIVAESLSNDGSFCEESETTLIT